MATWKERIEPAVVAKAENAVKAVGARVDSVCFDFTNSLVRVGVPDDVDDAARHALVAAVRRETGVGAYAAGPPVYPFTVHLQRPRLPVFPASLQDGVLEFRLRAGDLSNLRSAYSDVGRRCASAAKVATFALGGLVPLQFVTRLDRSTFASEQDFLEALSALQAKYHLFPGLLWTEDGTNARLFQDWLSSVGAIDHLVLFDTTFSGGAIGRIQNVVSEWAARTTGPVPSRVTILGVVDDGRLKGAVVKDERQDVTTASGTTLSVTTEFLHARSLVAEDVNDLVGYEALRSVGEVAATWTSAIVRVEDDAGVTLDVIGTRTLPASFADLLDGRFRNAPLDKEFAAMTTAFGVLMCIRQAAAKERDELSRARSVGLISEKELRDEMERVKRAESGALKRYKRFFDAL